MSMWFNAARLSAASFEAIRKEPRLVEALFFDSKLAKPADFDAERDVFGADYRLIGEMIEAMEESGIEEVAEDAGLVRHALGEEEEGSPIAYDFCYGPGFAMTPDEVKAVSKRIGKDDEGFGIGPFFAAAAKAGQGIIGGVS
ncbi:MAG: hypothetical protein R3F59_17435 [Myxococcota bacterium]